VFRKAIRRLVYSGAWDKIVKTLQDRWGAGRSPLPNDQLGLINERGELERLLTERSDPIELRRIRSALAYLDGKTTGEIANQEQVSKCTAYEDISTFRHGGASGLIKKFSSTRSARGLLSDTQLAELLTIVYDGHSPYRPGRPITRGEIIRVCQERFGVIYTPGGITDMLQRRGIDLKKNAERIFAEKMKAAQQAA
jgi:transposase